MWTCAWPTTKCLSEIEADRSCALDVLWLDGPGELGTLTGYKTVRCQV